MLSSDYTYRDLDYPGRVSQKSNLISILLYIGLKKITTNTPSLEIQFDIALYALCARFSGSIFVGCTYFSNPLQALNYSEDR